MSRGLARCLGWLPRVRSHERGRSRLQRNAGGAPALRGTSRVMCQASLRDAGGCVVGRAPANELAGYCHSSLRGFSSWGRAFADDFSPWSGRTSGGRSRLQRNAGGAPALRGASRVMCQASLRDASECVVGRAPANELAGYCRSSLRDFSSWDRSLADDFSPWSGRALARAVRPHERGRSRPTSPQRNADRGRSARQPGAAVAT